MTYTKNSRVFSPLVIYHENTNHHVQYGVKLEAYKEKITKMMERNAKLWSSKEDFHLNSNDDHDLNVSPSTSTTSTTSTSSCDSIETIEHPSSHTFSEPYIHHSSSPPSAFQPVYPSSYYYNEKKPSFSTITTDIYLSKTTSTALTLSSPPPPPPALLSPTTTTTTTTTTTSSSSNNTTTTANATQKKRRRGNLPKDVTEFLKQWLVQHKKHPYPSEKEKIELAHHTGLTVNQISNWFINARRRILQPMLESEGLQANLLSYHHPPSLPPSSTHHNSSLNDSRKPSINNVDQKKKRQLDIYTYQGFHESYQDDTRKWAFRRTKLPNYEMEDHYAVATR
ncbi:hypothetical protein BJ944DRAFT_240954 [Cunninghamella echinulata]|nr:hypothetical protein BJ944DRAFT_240954 [Cunninghamella echinulata]